MAFSPITSWQIDGEIMETLTGFIFLELSWMSCLYIFEVNPLSVASFAIIFSQTEGCLFTLTYSFPNLERVPCSMSGSNCCFLTCIQVSQKAGNMVWYSHL